jgi:hypothetical protein
MGQKRAAPDPRWRKLVAKPRRVLSARPSATAKGASPLVVAGLSWIWLHCTAQRLQPVMERMICSMCRYSRHAIEPRLRRLQLGGKCQQARFLIVAACKSSAVQCNGTLIAGVPVAL